MSKFDQLKKAKSQSEVLSLTEEILKESQRQISVLAADLATLKKRVADLEGLANRK
jgi:hypothetical protein